MAQCLSQACKSHCLVELGVDKGNGHVFVLVRNHANLLCNLACWMQYAPANPKMLTLLSNDLLHFVQALQRMVGDTVAKHDNTEVPLQVIHRVLFARVGLHVKFTDLNRMGASFCACIMGLLSGLLTLACSPYTQIIHIACAQITGKIAAYCIDGTVSLP